MLAPRRRAQRPRHGTRMWTTTGDRVSAGLQGSCHRQITTSMAVSLIQYFIELAGPIVVQKSVYVGVSICASFCGMEIDDPNHRHRQTTEISWEGCVCPYPTFLCHHPTPESPAVVQGICPTRGVRRRNPVSVFFWYFQSELGHASLPCLGSISNPDQAHHLVV